MIIKRVIINNFRGIKRLDFAPGRRNLLVGRNGSGKTSALVALDYALNPNKYWSKGEFPDLDFHEHDPAANGKLWNGDECKGINIEVWLGDFRDNEDIQQDWELCLEHFGPDGKLANADNDDVAKASPLVRVTFSCGSDKTPQWYFTKPESNRRRFSAEDRRRVGFHYIPSWRNPLDELSLRDRSVLSRLLDGGDLSGKIDQIRQRFDASGKLLHEDETFSLGFGGLMKALQDARLVQQGPDALGLSALESTERSILRAFGLRLKPDGTDRPIPLRYLGSGTQNTAMLLALVALLSSNQSAIVAVEEPEQNLEPFYQRFVMRRFTDATAAGGQLFVTSFSNVLTSVFPEEDCYLVGRREQGEHLCHRVFEDFRGALGRQTKSRLADELAPVLLARGVLLLEGPSEYGALSVFSRLATRGLDAAGVEPFLCSGRDSMPGYCDYFRSLGLKAIVLMDWDDDKDARKRRKECAESADLVLLWPRRYEEALMTVPAFEAEFCRFAPSLLDWDEDQHIYKVNVFEKRKDGKVVSPSLASFRTSRAEEIDGAGSLDDLLRLLEEHGLKQEYLYELLHQRFSASYVARHLAELLTADNKARVPPAAKNLLLAVAAFMDGKLPQTDAGTEVTVDVSSTDPKGKSVVQHRSVGESLATNVIHLAEKPKPRETTDTASNPGEAAAD